MDCVCPYCGRKIEEGKIGFDMTEYLRSQLQMAAGFPGLVEEDKSRAVQIRAGIDAVFNNLPAGDHLIFGEEEIWNWKELTGHSSRTVMMAMPMEKLSGLFANPRGIEEKNRDIVRVAGDWLKSGAGILSTMCFPLILEKEGDGDIRFNLIRSPLDQRPVLKKRVCPHCMGTLSFWSGRYKELCLGVLGGPRVSKTTTLTACAYAFMKTGGYQGVTWQGTNMDDEFVQFEKDYMEKYRKGQMIGATKTTQNIPRVSFCVEVRDPRTHQMGTKLTLTFVDLPGELNNEKGIDDEFFNRYSHYFENLDYLWYCTDPGELLQLSETAENDSSVRELGYEGQKRVLNLREISDNMIRVASLFNRNKKSIPVAYIVGKTDSTLISLPDKLQYHLYAANPGPQHTIATQPFDIRYFCTDAVRVRTYMYNINPDLVNTFEANFPNHCYIAFSAYGFAPSEIQNDNLQPFNVTAPFMWMLALESCIQISKVVARSMGRFERVNYYLKHAAGREQQKDYFNLFVRGPYWD